METLAAIGLVGNIVQFIDFGSKLVAKSVQLYQSSDGALAENVDTETATNHLVLLNNKLRDANRTSDVELENLCKSCSTVADELIRALGELKVQGGQKRWKSMRKAIRTVWSKDKIQGIEKRLANFREVLSLHIIVDLRKQVCQAKLEQSGLLEGLDVTTETILHAIENQQDIYQVALHTQIASMGADVAAAHTGITQEIKLLKLDGNLAEQERRLAELHVDDAPFNSRICEHEPRCLPETRVDLLQRIMEWSKDCNGACMFWLNGMAGTGKSTIARTVARAFADQKRLGASFFFSRGRGDLSHAGKFFTTLAAQLSHTVPTLRSHVCGAMAENFNIASSGLGEQWKRLIFQPLSNLGEVSPQSQIFILVIDALDECENDRDVRLILQLFAEVATLKTVRLRVIVTSRPETPIRLGFRAMPGILHHDLLLHDVPRAVVDDDISTFLRHEFGVIKDEFEELPVDWPGERNIDLLVQRADGLFIYAATVCRFIKGDEQWPPEDLLSLFLRGDTTGYSLMENPDEIAHKSPTWELDGIYLQILEYSFKKVKDERDKPKLADMFRKVVGSIVILSEPLSATSLARLLAVQKHAVDLRLRHLHSVLHASESQESRIRLLHPSFRDFLLDKKRCRNPQFWVDEKNTHDALAKSCLELMSKNLRRDMCSLRLPGILIAEVEKSRVQEHIPPDVQYACRYWVHHLQRGNNDLCYSGQVHTFLNEHFLHWLEALSLMGSMSDGVIMVRALESTLTLECNTKSPLLTMIHDAKRFILSYRSIIEEAPLQIYCSALMFSPEKSEIRRQFWNQAPCWVTNLAMVQEDWSPSLQVLEGHSSAVTTLAFSPDGQLLASASYDKTVRLWDPTTGALRGTLDGHSGCVRAVVFSPDSQLLASASDDRTVKLWDPTTGALHHTFERHKSWVRTVAFSPDGQLLAIASADPIVELWDPMTGTLHSTLDNHFNPIGEVAFSPDGHLLASPSDDGLVRLWDPATAALCGTLEGHSRSVQRVAFSPDGRLLASASRDDTIKLWDSMTGALLGTLEGHLGGVNAIVFSPDGHLLASTADVTIRLWDPTTGVLRGTLYGHSSEVTMVAFSTDGQLLTSASRDNTIRLWDLATGTPRGTLNGHLAEVNMVAFSPDGRLLASASNDETVRFWDPTMGASPGALDGHSSWFSAVEFSPDGQLLASGSHGGLVRLWDPMTGALRSMIEGHLNLVSAVAFSPDSQLLASASADATVKLWDPMTGALHSTLEGHFHRARAVVFSPDGQLLASTSYDNIIKLWDTTTGILHSEIEAYSDWVSAVAFSPDGQLLASASGTGIVELWDLMTGALHCTLEDHLKWVYAFAFSPDGQLLASASSDKIVRLWDIKTKKAIQRHNTSDIVFKLSFTNDGSQLITNRGMLELGIPARKGQSQLKSSPHICMNDHWVDCNKENVLWLPPDYRTQSFALRNNILVLGRISDQITFLKFQLDSIPLSAQCS